MAAIMTKEARRIGTLGDQSSPETYGGGAVYELEDGRVVLEYTLGAEAEEGAFAPDKPTPRCDACNLLGKSYDNGDCDACDGKGHLFAFDVHRCDVEPDVFADLNWADAAAVARSIGMADDTLLDVTGGAKLREMGRDPNPQLGLAELDRVAVEVRPPVVAGDRLVDLGASAGRTPARRAAGTGRRTSRSARRARSRNVNHRTPRRQE